MLKKYAGYDNTPFIKALEEMGFYVAQCSQTNYAQTAPSISSSLNFNYLDKIGLDLAAAKREDAIAPYIKHNAVVEQMRGMGYRIVAFETGYDFSTIDDADILYPAPESGVSDFELTLLRSRMLVLLDDAGLLQGIYHCCSESKGHDLRAARDIERSAIRPRTEVYICPSLNPLPSMIERRRGDVLFVSSMNSVSPRPFQSGYTVAKAGIEGFAAALRMDLEGTGVRAITLRLGPTRSEFGYGWNTETMVRVLESWQRWGFLRHHDMLDSAQVAHAVVAAVTSPRGMQLDVIQLNPEAPIVE